MAPPQARALTAMVPAGILRVGLVVDAEDRAIDAILGAVPLDLLQLHGAETPARVADDPPPLRAAGDQGDGQSPKPPIWTGPQAYAEVADRLLFDARPPQGRDAAGRQRPELRLAAAGRARLAPAVAAGRRPRCRQHRRAVGLSGATAVDVSSGVEDAPGRKSIAKIRAFLAAAGAHRQPDEPSPADGRAAGIRLEQRPWLDVGRFPACATGQGAYM